MNFQPIGMFDSGVGGLTVLSEIQKILPKEDVIYLGDTKRFPYGSKSEQTIIELSRKCVEFLISKNVKLIVIACGTATSQALSTLQKEYDIPIIGIIQPTVEYLKTKVKQAEEIGIIATKGTIRSGEWERQIKKQIEACNLNSMACPLLAPMAEEGWVSNKVAQYTIKEYMKPFRNANYLVLGCTHYPLFKNLILQELGNEVDVINTGEKLSDYLKKYLEERKWLNPTRKKEYEIYLTDTESNFIQIAQNLLQNENSISKIKRVEI